MVKKLKGYATVEEATKEKFDKIINILSNADLSVFEEINKSRKRKENIQNS